MCQTHPHKRGQNTKYPSGRASYGGDNKHIMLSTNFMYIHCLFDTYCCILKFSYLYFFV